MNENEFGARLTALRKEVGISQHELAERIQVADATISHLEMGRRMPSIEVAMRLASEFNVSLDMLLGATAPATSQVPG